MLCYLRDFVYFYGINPETKSSKKTSGLRQKWMKFGLKWWKKWMFYLVKYLPYDMCEYIKIVLTRFNHRVSASFSKLNNGGVSSFMYSPTHDVWCQTPLTDVYKTWFIGLDWPKKDATVTAYMLIIFNSHFAPFFVMEIMLLFIPAGSDADDTLTQVFLLNMSD